MQPRDGAVIVLVPELPSDDLAGMARSTDHVSDVQDGSSICHALLTEGTG